MMLHHERQPIQQWFWRMLTDPRAAEALLLLFALAVIVTLSVGPLQLGQAAQPGDGAPTETPSYVAPDRRGPLTTGWDD